MTAKCLAVMNSLIAGVDDIKPETTPLEDEEIGVN